VQEVVATFFDCAVPAKGFRKKNENKNFAKHTLLPVIRYFWTVKPKPFKHMKRNVFMTIAVAVATLIALPAFHKR